MLVNFNVDEVQRLLILWRKNVDLQAPMNDELKITFMIGRRKLLDTYVDVSAVLMQMMGQMSPVDDLEDFNTTKEAIRQFGLWAQNGLIEIERMHD